MRISSAAAFCAIGALWIVTAGLWPDLPEHIPTHFGRDGRPDAFADQSLSQWLLLPAIASLLTALLAVALPAWFRRLVAANSRWVNVPWKERFRALPTTARLRAVEPTLALLRLIAAAVAALFAFLQYGIAMVAAGVWPALPEPPLLIAIAAIAATALLTIPLTGRAVRREERLAAVIAGAASPR